MAQKKKNVQKETTEEILGNIPEKGPEQQAAERFEAEATERAKNAAVFFVRNKAALEDGDARHDALRETANAYLSTLEADALQLSEYGERGIQLHVASFIQHYNRCMVRASHALHREGLAEISFDFLHQQPLDFSNFGDGEGGGSRKDEEKQEGRERGEPKKRTKKDARVEHDLGKKEEVEFARKVQKEVQRIQADSQRVRAWAQTAKTTVNVFAEGPLGARFADEVAYLRTVQEEMFARVHELEGIEAGATVFLEAVSAAGADERRAILEKLESFTTNALVGEIDRLRDKIAGEQRKLRGLIKVEIESIFAQLQGDQVSVGAKLVKHLQKEVERGNDKKLVDILEKMQKVLRESPVSAPETSASASVPESIDPASEPESRVSTVPPFEPSFGHGGDAGDSLPRDFFTDEAQEYVPEASVGAETAGESSGSENDSQKSKRERRRRERAERPELPPEEKQRLEDFCTFVQGLNKILKDPSAQAARKLRELLDNPPAKSASHKVKQDFKERVRACRKEKDAFEQHLEAYKASHADYFDRQFAMGVEIARRLVESNKTYRLDSALYSRVRIAFLSFFGGLSPEEYFALWEAEQRKKSVRGTEEVQVSSRVEDEDDGVLEQEMRNAFDGGDSSHEKGFEAEEIPDEPTPVFAEEWLDEDEEEKPIPPSLPRTSSGPEDRPEPGPVPEREEKESRPPEPEGIRGRVRAWIKRAEDATIYRTHIKGELTEAEAKGAAPTLSRAAMLAGGVLSGVLSYYGAAFPLDAVRYATQRHFVGKERDELIEAFRVALEERRLREFAGLPEEAVAERNQALRERVEGSRYLTTAQKADLLAKLSAQQDAFVAIAFPRHEHVSREVGRILEHAIRTRVTGEKVAKEALNTGLMLTGFGLLRAPAYGLVSLYRRWNGLTRERPDSPAGDRLRGVVAGGFSEWWDKARGNKGRLAQAAAVGTAARFVGMAAVGAEALAGSGMISNLFAAWEHQEPVYPPEAAGFSQENLANIEGRLREHVPEAPEAPRVVSAAEVFSPVESPGIGEPLPDVLEEPVMENEVILAPEKIPQEALLHEGDGVTQSLLHAVEARPDLLSAADRAALSDDYASALLMRRFAARDGLLDYWMSEDAAGKLAIVPTYDAAGVGHINFLNPETGTAYSLQELKDLGWIFKAPKAAA